MTNKLLRKEFEEEFGAFSNFTVYEQFFGWFLAKRKEEIDARIQLLITKIKELADCYEGGLLEVSEVIKIIEENEK